MDEQTRQFIEMNNPIFCLFESTCPECGEEAKIVSAGGTLDFLQGWDWPEGVDPVIWEDTPERWEEGGIGFECCNGHKFYVERNIHGDWN